MAKYTTIEQLRARSAKTKDVEIGSWGTFRIQALSVAERDQLNEVGFDESGTIDFPKYREFVLDKGTVEPHIAPEILAELRDDEEELVGSLMEEITIFSGIIKRPTPKGEAEEADDTAPLSETT